MTTLHRTVQEGASCPLSQPALLRDPDDPDTPNPEQEGNDESGNERIDDV